MGFTSLTWGDCWEDDWVEEFAAWWREDLMKKAIVLFLFVSAMLVLAQEKTSINVKDSSTSTGVVVVSAEMGGKSVELQCNLNTQSCAQLKPGKYQMVQLPKNYGMYDCQNADVYDLSATPGTDQRIGEYCLTVK